MFLAKNIRYLRRKNNYSQDFIAEQLGYKSYTTVQKWEMGISEPPVKKVEALARLFQVDINDIVNKDIERDITPVTLNIPKFNLSPHEEVVITAYHNQPHTQPFVDKLLGVKRENTELSKELIPDIQEEEQEMISMKVYDQKAAAGLGNYLTDYSDDEYESIYFPICEVNCKADFGIRIKGDSMEPKISDGDIVWVKSKSAIEDGEIGIFVMDDKSYCKKLCIDYENKKVSLISLNPKYKPIIAKEDIRTIGKVLF